MPQYKCTKCDETACSKNPATRNVFLEDWQAAMLSNLVNIETTRKPNGLRQVTLTFPYLESGTEAKPRPDEKLELDALTAFQGVAKETLLHLVCNHDWQIIEGTGDEL